MNILKKIHFFIFDSSFKIPILVIILYYFYDSINTIKVDLDLNMEIMKLNNSFYLFSSSRLSKYYNRTQNRVIFLDYYFTRYLEQPICDLIPSISNSSSKKYNISKKCFINNFR